MDKELLNRIKNYIERMERDMMWECSANIVSDEELYADTKRMPQVYFEVCELLKNN